MIKSKLSTLKHFLKISLMVLISSHYGMEGNPSRLNNVFEVNTLRPKVKINLSRGYIRGKTLCIARGKNEPIIKTGSRWTNNGGSYTDKQNLIKVGDFLESLDFTKTEGSIHTLMTKAHRDLEDLTNKNEQDIEIKKIIKEKFFCDLNKVLKKDRLTKNSILRLTAQHINELKKKHGESTDLLTNIQETAKKLSMLDYKRDEINHYKNKKIEQFFHQYFKNFSNPSDQETIDQLINSFADNLKRKAEELLYLTKTYNPAVQNNNEFLNHLWDMERDLQAQLLEIKKYLFNVINGHIINKNNGTMDNHPTKNDEELNKSILSFISVVMLNNLKNTQPIENHPQIQILHDIISLDLHFRNHIKYKRKAFCKKLGLEYKTKAIKKKTKFLQKISEKKRKKLLEKQIKEKVQQQKEEFKQLAKAIKEGTTKFFQAYSNPNANLEDQQTKALEMSALWMTIVVKANNNIQNQS
jgi:hypothetical protein